MIVEKHPDGLPVGRYGVLYYRLRDGRFIMEGGCDRDVPESYIKRIKVAANEVARATCNSSPGGATIFGSAKVKAAWDRLGEGDE